MQIIRYRERLELRKDTSRSRAKFVLFDEASDEVIAAAFRARDRGTYWEPNVWIVHALHDDVHG